MDSIGLLLTLGSMLTQTGLSGMVGLEAGLKAKG
jgi:hypothetical protein